MEPMIVMALVLLAAAWYAQTHIARFTAGQRNVVLTRAVLAGVGVAAGIAGATIYGASPFMMVLAFLSGFGAVHVPAAFILLIKAGRGAGQT